MPLNTGVYRVMLDLISSDVFHGSLLEIIIDDDNDKDDEDDDDDDK